MTYPNQLTTLRIILTPAIIYCLMVPTVGYRTAALLLFFVASLTDWYDGYIARKFDWVSEWGKFLDPLADKILVLSTFTTFFVIGELQLWMVLVITLRDISITLLRIYALRRQLKFNTSVFAKWKTASQMTAIYIILIYLLIREQMVRSGEVSGWFSTLESFAIVDNLMYLVTFITAMSGIHYFIENRQHLKSCASAFCRIFLPTIF